MPLSVDVIVRTLAHPSRSKLLFRALDSIQDQSGVAARPIVVVNGQKFDGGTLAALQRRPGILLYQEQRASTGVACAVGRQLVTAPFFSYLDDDDELIAGSLLAPAEWLRGHSDCDVVVSNGYFVKSGRVHTELIHIADHISIGKPAMSLLADSWLQPGAFICRTASIPLSMIEPNWNHMEWTYLAYKFCTEHKRLHFMDVATVRYSDTPGSMSKGLKQREAELDLLRLIRNDAQMDVDVRRTAGRKYLRTLHDMVMSNLREGEYLRAWRCHLGSLRPPYTLKYLLFSRKLLWPFGVNGG